MRRERLRLTDMIEAADAVAGFVSTVDADEFARSDLVHSAVVYKLVIIGEAAAHISPETREKSPAIPWPQVVAFRNFTVHEYFAVSWRIVWHTATVFAPSLRAEVATLLATMPAEDEQLDG